MGLFTKKQTKIEQAKAEIKDLSFKNFILPQKIKWEKDYIDASNGLLTSYLAIKGFPKKTNQQILLKRIGAIKGVTLYMDFEKISYDKFSNQLEKTVRNMTDSTKNKMTDVTKLSVNYDSSEKFSRDILENNLQTFKGTILVKVVADSKEELNKRRNAVQSAIKSFSGLEDALHFLQRNSFISSMPFNTNLIKKYIEFPFTAKTASNLWIPNFAQWRQPKGYPIGIVHNGGSFVLDPFERNEHMSNSNFSIEGQSGQGKSYLAKKIVLNEAMNGTSIVILDPQNEYLELISKLGGVCMDIPKMNIMQVRTQDAELKENFIGKEEAMSESSNFKYHLNFLRIWYKAYTRCSDASKEDKCFEFLCKEVYKNHNISEKSDFDSLESKDYPLLQDVYDLAKSLAKLKKSEIIEREIAWTNDDLLEVAKSLETAVGTGSDSIYFNVHTDAPISTDAQILLAIRLDKVSELEDNTKSAVYLNLNNFVSSLIFKDKKTRFMYLWDEMHKGIDKSANAENHAIKFFATAYKIARKYEASIGYSTTSPQELHIPSIAPYTNSIMGQCAIKFIFNMRDKDFKALITNSTNINEVEQKTIVTLPKRSCLIKIGSDLSFRVAISGADLSNLKGNEDPYILAEAQLFGEAGGR